MHKSIASRRAFAAFAAATLLIGSLPVEARVGSSSSSSSSSRSSSMSSASRPSSSIGSSASASRAGGGGSMGMSRPQVMNSVRSTPSPAPSSTNQYASSGSTYRQPTSAPEAPKKDLNWVAPAAAGVAAGALATYALTRNDNSNHQNYANQPNSAPSGSHYGGGSGMPPEGSAQNLNAGSGMANQLGGAALPSNNAVAPASSGFGFGGLLLVLLLVGAGFLLFRRLRAADSTPGAGATTYAAPVSKAYSDTTDTEALNQARQLFNELQDINNRADRTALRAVTTGEMFEALSADFVGRSEPSRTQVVQMDCAIVDDSYEGGRRVLSVQFEGLVREGDGAPEAVMEVWHFTKAAGEQWKVAGIEQV